MRKLLAQRFLVFRLTKPSLVFNNGCLSFLQISVGHMYLPAPQLEDWTYEYKGLNSDVHYADKIHEEILLNYF
jgi:hypothetical protein